MSMKTRLITLSVILVATISIIVTLLIPKTKMFLGVYDANSGMRKTDQINKSPYAIFGDSSKTLMTENERTSNHTLEIKNTNKGERTFKLELNAQTGKIRLFDKTGNVISELLLEPEQLTRFVSVDRFAEKYYDLTPYHYGANNPILYIDINGDSISVAQQYREQFMNDMQNVFGDNTNLFSFSESGMLAFDGKKKDLTKEQKQVFKGMNKLMNSKDVYGVAYESSYTTKDGSQTIDVDGKNAGGAMFYATDNVIVISPNITGGDVISLDPSSFFKNVNVDMNTTTGLFHEFGEALAGKSQYRGSVVDYENVVRKVMKMTPRPYDLYHQPVPPTQPQ